MKRIVPSLVFLGLTTVLPAQIPATVVGLVEKVPAGACNAKATHKVGCSDLLLTEEGTDLSAVVGQFVTLSGTFKPSLRCTTLAVSSITPAPQRTTALAPLGYKLGRPVVFTTFAPLGSVVVYVFGTGPGFVPLGSTGSWLMQLQGSVYWATDISIGIAIRPVTIPNDPSLVGTQLRMQTLSVGISPLAINILNPTCFTISS